MYAPLRCRIVCDVHASEKTVAFFFTDQQSLALTGRLQLEQNWRSSRTRVRRALLWHWHWQACDSVRATPQAAGVTASVAASGTVTVPARRRARPQAAFASGVSDVSDHSVRGSVCHSTACPGIMAHAKREQVPTACVLRERACRTIPFDVTDEATHCSTHEHAALVYGAHTRDTRQYRHDTHPQRMHTQV